jgi:tRNA pseudouridine55 synthase
MPEKFFGLLNVNKPAGRSSRDVVNVVQRLAGQSKVGHAGTLDPLATGVLVLCLGPATRLIEYVQRMPKSYRGKFLLGRSSPTEDIEGEVSLLPEAKIPTRGEIDKAAARLTGAIQQRPPAFSALKVAGKRAYDLARAGKPVELKPRPVTIYELKVVEYAYPELSLDIRCSSGTYVRSLGRDLAESVGSAAVMSELTRTAIGPFGIDTAVAPERLTRDNLAAELLPAVGALADLPQLVLDAAEENEIANGRRIVRDPLPPSEFQGFASEYAAMREDGTLLALLTDDPQGRLRPVRVFVQH